MLNNTFSGDESVCKIPDPEVSTSSPAVAELAQETSNFFSHYHVGEELGRVAQKATCSFPGFWPQVWCIRFTLLQNSL